MRRCVVDGRRRGWGASLRIAVTQIPLVLALIVTAALQGACREPEPMPLDPSATWLVASPPTAAGSPFEIVLFVRAPTGHRVHAYELPVLDGIDVVERRILPASAEGALAVHREALLVRTRGAGLHRWPEGRVRVMDEAGETYELALEAIELEVPSVLGEGAPPRRPRGYRDPPPEPLPAPFAWGFGAGALAMGAIALLLVRRGRRRRVDAEPGIRGPGAPARRFFGGAGRLRGQLGEARALASADADGAAAGAALALRHWAADRFLVSTHARSVEELRHARPDRASAPDWRAWLDRLEAIERARFGAGDDAEKARAVAREIDAAEAFVDAIDGVGPEARGVLPADRPR